MPFIKSTSSSRYKRLDHCVRERRTKYTPPNFVSTFPFMGYTAAVTCWLRARVFWEPVRERLGSPLDGTESHSSGLDKG